MDAGELIPMIAFGLIVGAAYVSGYIRGKEAGMKELWRDLKAHDSEVEDQP